MQDSLANKPRELAALFMLLVIAWNTAEFALQPVRRPPSDEILVLCLTLGILIFLPYVRSGGRWAVLGALAAVAIHWVLAIAGLWIAGANDGFGKYRPAVALLLLTIALNGAFRAWRTA